jgi:hypothetical protein
MGDGLHRAGRWQCPGAEEGGQRMTNSYASERFPPLLSPEEAMERDEAVVREREAAVREKLVRQSSANYFTYLCSQYGEDAARRGFEEVLRRAPNRPPSKWHQVACGYRDQLKSLGVPDATKRTVAMFSGDSLIGQGRTPGAVEKALERADKAARDASGGKRPGAAGDLLND